jgi:hypothetical protein
LKNQTAQLVNNSLSARKPSTTPVAAIKPIVCISLLIMLQACQTPMSSGSQCVVEDGYLRHENSFTWHNETPIDLDDTTGLVSPITVKALEQSVMNHLATKNFSFVARNDDAPSDQWSDVEIAITLKVRRELSAHETSASVCEESDCWERIAPGSSSRTVVTTVGFLAADAYYLGEPIWRGWVETTLYPSDRGNEAAIIGRAIPKLFETFPP